MTCQLEPDECRYDLDFEWTDGSGESSQTTAQGKRRHRAIPAPLASISTRDTAHTDGMKAKIIKTISEATQISPFPIRSRKATAIFGIPNKSEKIPFSVHLHLHPLRSEQQYARFLAENFRRWEDEMPMCSDEELIKTEDQVVIVL